MDEEDEDEDFFDFFFFFFWGSESDESLELAGARPVPVAECLPPPPPLLLFFRPLLLFFLRVLPPPEESEELLSESELELEELSVLLWETDLLRFFALSDFSLSEKEKREQQLRH